MAPGHFRGAPGGFGGSRAADPRRTPAATREWWAGEARRRGATVPGSPAAARAERMFRAALPLAPPAPLAAHAEVGVALLTLRRGDAAEAEAALERALRSVPPQPLALVARYLLGVARLQLGRPAE